MIKGSAHRLPETVAPPAGRGNATLAALRTADEMAAVRGTAPQAGTGGVRPCTMTGSAPSGGCRLCGRYAGRAGWRRTRADGTCPPPCAGSRFFADWRPGQGRKNARNPHAQHCPPAFRPTFCPVPALRHGKTASLSAPSPGSSRYPAVALPAPLLRWRRSPLSPRQRPRGASGAWR